jgi:hypothetical protein
MNPETGALERGKILGMLFMGCDLEIAAQTVGWTEERLHEECKINIDFASEVALTQGKVELHHMRNVHKAGEDVKNWRASAWWLARRSAERRERKKDFAVTMEDLCLWIENIVEIAWAEVKAEEDRDRFTTRLLAVLNAQDRATAAAIVGKEDFDQVFGNASTTKA